MLSLSMYTPPKPLKGKQRRHGRLLYPGSWSRVACQVAPHAQHRKCESLELSVESVNNRLVLYSMEDESTVTWPIQGRQRLTRSEAALA